MSTITSIAKVGPEEGLYSSDDHIDLCYVPTDMWQTRVAAQWQENAPKVVKNAAGQPVWMREGRPWGIQGSKRVDGRKVPFDDLGLSEEAAPGVFRPASAQHRLEDMDRDRVYSQVLYNFVDWGFEDPLLKEVCTFAFNDWIAELCAADRDRLIGLAVLPTHDPQTTIRELERTAKLGLRGAMFEFTGATLPVYDRAWDPLWKVAEEAGIAISFHLMMTSRLRKSDLRDHPWLIPARASYSCMMLNEVMAQLIFSGVTVRHPGLKLVLAESSLGWIPFMLERLEYEQENYRHLGDALPREPARELFRRNFYCTFQEEKLGVRLIPEIGEDNVMWASDYPHGDSSFPRSVQVVEKIFEGMDPAIKRKATRDTMKKLYRIA